MLTLISPRVPSGGAVGVLHPGLYGPLFYPLWEPVLGAPLRGRLVISTHIPGSLSPSTARSGDNVRKHAIHLAG